MTTTDRSFTTERDLDFVVSVGGVVAIDGFTATLTVADMGRMAAALTEIARERRDQLKRGKLEPLSESEAEIAGSDVPR